MFIHKILRTVSFFKNYKQICEFGELQSLFNDVKNDSCEVYSVFSETNNNLLL